jgi:hypothetical protein
MVGTTDSSQNATGFLVTTTGVIGDLLHCR